MLCVTWDSHVESETNTIQRFILDAYTGKSSTASDEEQSSGKEAGADLGYKNGMRKDKGLLGGDKVLWSNGAKGESGTERMVRLDRATCL